jgi:hypothetical protein
MGDEGFKYVEEVDDWLSLEDRIDQGYIEWQYPKSAALVMEYEDEWSQKELSPPPDTAPTKFWLSVLYYGNLASSSYKKVMGHVTNFSHLSVHAWIELEEMAGEYPKEWLFWMFEELGYPELGALTK